MERATARTRKGWVGTYRLAVLAAICGALFYASKGKESAPWEPSRVLLEAQVVVPEATALGEAKEGLVEILGEGEAVLGWVTMTSPASDGVVGYSGATNLLVVFDPAGVIQGMRVLDSADTKSHLTRIEREADFWKQWRGRKASDSPREPVVVSGATLTSEAIAKAMRARFLGESDAGFYDQESSLSPIQESNDEVESLRPVPERRGSYELLDGAGQGVGYLLRSGNRAGQARGFNATQDVWVLLDARGETVEDVRLQGTRDNEPYILDVQEELKWTEAYRGKAVSELASDPRSGDLIFPVSGATVTAGSIAETVRGLLREWQRELTKTSWWQGRDWSVVAWMALALGLGWSRWKGRKWVRWVTEAAAIAVGGLWLGVMIGMGSLVGWSRGGLPWESFPGLVLVAAVAVLVPVTTGKNAYCARLCAHGAAQGILFRLTKWRWVPGARTHRGLKSLRWLLLTAVVLLAAMGLRRDFSAVEPFDVWSVGFYALIPSVIWVLGLVLSLFVPKAYCKYGCPTGYLLEHLTASRGRFQPRDGWAGLLALVAWLGVWVAGRMA
ncbi:FMN-binding protein [Roseibacillus persicicus]|uniref:FMN-binding protein n=1 Tax=Roseibacillus persicicus TaxID=454148 RepID=UPI00398A8B71